MTNLLNTGSNYMPKLYGKTIRHIELHKSIANSILAFLIRISSRMLRKNMIIFLCRCTRLAQDSFSSIFGAQILLNTYVLVLLMFQMVVSNKQKFEDIFVMFPFDLVWYDTFS